MPLLLSSINSDFSCYNIADVVGRESGHDWAKLSKIGCSRWNMRQLVLWLLSLSKMLRRLQFPRMMKAQMWLTSLWIIIYYFREERAFWKALPATLTYEAIIPMVYRAIQQEKEKMVSTHYKRISEYTGDKNPHCLMITNLDTLSKKF